MESVLPRAQYQRRHQCKARNWSGLALISPPDRAAVMGPFGTTREAGRAKLQARAPGCGNYEFVPTDLLPAPRNGQIFQYYLAVQKYLTGDEPVTSAHPVPDSAR